ncbi:hypothetical protein BDP27DRAFT_1386363 [Rhodocollybia butyracea]|uniref:Ricin B lectin domain-containing protein n=1 Tax=Rhodocollybia butyracea TaxID=206335 RepID=A0A9P5P7B4_9AGAR|nr:hypothetical protein BDP27DRAFT_1386363 [Rhodocollybia butyracea]
MIHATIVALLAAGFALSAPINPRDVTLNPTDVAQAQVRDNTATRAFSAAQIQTAEGECLAVDPASGDFRENLIPIQIVACNGSDTQQWDIITSGVHNNKPGFALVVSTLTNGCLNFDPRRAAGNQVLLFSCGGRADGSGAVANSQLFTFTGGAGPLPLVPQNGNNATCLTVNHATGLLDQTSCDASTASGDELFTISAQPSTGSSGSSSAAVSSSAVTATLSASSVVAVASTSTPVAPVATTTVTASGATGTTVLVPSAVAQAQVRDNTATRAFSAAQLKTSDGNCLFVDPNAGDFRENLIPITAQPCDGSANQQWDVITAGVHNNVPGTALFVSSLTQGCLNFDPRRAVGNQVILFSCGGRADGSGAVTNSQLFTFSGNETTIPLIPTNQANTCLFDNNGNLDDQTCDTTKPAGNQLFTIVP